jgi:hypothetical protein
MRYHQENILEVIYPLYFAEHRELQLANVLKSDRATQVSIKIIEVFVKMREMLSDTLKLRQSHISGIICTKGYQKCDPLATVMPEPPS